MKLVAKIVVLAMFLASGCSNCSDQLNNDDLTSDGSRDGGGGSDIGDDTEGPSGSDVSSDMVADSQAVCARAQTEQECRELGCAGMLEVRDASGAPPECAEDFSEPREICVLRSEWLSGSDVPTVLWRKDDEEYEVIIVPHQTSIDGWNVCEAEAREGEPDECECARTAWGAVIG
jgi:hypothetical protein